MSDSFYQEAANAYIVAYNTAMERTHDPEIAKLVASAVAMSYMALFKGEAYLQKQSIEFIFGALTAAVIAQQGSQDDGEDSEKK